MNNLFHNISVWLKSSSVAPDLIHVGLVIAVGLGVLLGLALIYWISKKLLGLTSKRLQRFNQRYYYLNTELERVTNYLSLLVPAIIFYQIAPLFISGSHVLAGVVENVCDSYFMIITALILGCLADAGAKVLKHNPAFRDTALKSYVQVFKIGLYVIFGILILALFIHESPWKIISGLGALTALILLTFKDSLLGFVASIQLSANQLVREGDWVEMPKFGANGDVFEINLTTVKVRNFDMTITSIPTYAFISDSFKNWRGMSESGGRRVKRAINIDKNSIRFCSAELLERLKKVELLQSYFKERENRIALTVQPYTHNSERLNHPQITNLGAFRHYAHEYLLQHPMVNKEMTIIVRQLAPGATGLPLEIYVFLAEKRWAEYESIQSDIFDHLFSAIPLFDLSLFQSPTGNDFLSLTKPENQHFSSNKPTISA